MSFEQQTRQAESGGAGDDDLLNSSGNEEVKGGCCRFVGRIVSVIQRAVQVILPPGGVLATAFNLASVSIGAGILGLPSASDTCGLALALIYLIIVTLLSIFTMGLIGIVCEKTQLKSFEATSQYLFPQWNYAFSYFAAFIRWLQGIAGCVAYIISVGNCLSPIFEGALRRHPDNKHLKFLATKSGNRFLTSMIWLGVMVPLVIPRHIDSLRYASAIAVLFMCYFVLIMVIHSCTHGLPEHKGNVITVAPKHNPPVGPYIFLFREGNDSAASIGVFFFIFLLQINAYEASVDLRRDIRDAKHLTIASAMGLVMVCILYVLVCVFAYFDFGAEALAGNSILLMYDPLEEPEVMVAYVGVLIKLCVAFAMLTLTARNSTYYLIGWQDKYRTRRPPGVATHAAGHHRGDADTDVEMVTFHPVVKPVYAAATTEGPTVGDAYIDDGLEDATTAREGDGPASHDNGNDKDDTLKSHTEPPPTADTHHVNPLDDTVEDTSYIDNIPFWKHVTAVMVIATATLIMGLFIPKINMVLGFSGGICGGCIAFLFPALFFMYAGNFSLRESGWFLYFGTYLSAFVGVVGIVWGTAGTIYDII